jgi:hypothetical protein
LKKIKYSYSICYAGVRYPDFKKALQYSRTISIEKMKTLVTAIDPCLLTRSKKNKQYLSLL